MRDVESTIASEYESTIMLACGARVTRLAIAITSIPITVYGATLARLCATRSVLRWNTECFVTVVEMGRVAFKTRLS